MTELGYIPEGPETYRMIRKDSVPQGVKFTVDLPKDATRVLGLQRGRQQERPNHGAVQPDVQFYTPYRGKRTPLTGTAAQRKDKIRELDRKEYGHEADRREVVNLD